MLRINFRNREGQMSLEMIIGLLILLVVAVVVIRMFLGSMEKMEEIGQYKKTIEYKNFISECEKACSDYLAYGVKSHGAKYCSHRYGKVGTDIDKDGIIETYSPEEAGSTKMLPICEDGIYCFHVVKCGTETSSIDWSDCKNILCSAYYETYQDWNQANTKVLELFPQTGTGASSRVGTCTIPSTDNWWDMYFGENPCLD